MGKGEIVLLKDVVLEVDNHIPIDAQCVYVQYKVDLVGYQSKRRAQNWEGWGDGGQILEELVENWKGIAYKCII